MLCVARSQGDITRAAAVIEKARAAGLNPDVHSWSPYLLALARKGDAAAALAAAAQMQAEGVQANAWVYSALVEALIQVGGWEGCQSWGRGAGPAV